MVLVCNSLCWDRDWAPYLTLLQDLNAQDQDEDPMNKLKGQKIVSCRICKGDHWTTRCPYKDTLGPMQKELAEQLGLSTADKEKPAGSGTISTSVTSSDSDLFFMIHYWTWWLVVLLFLQLNQSLQRLHRARLGSMYPRAWGMEARGGASPCSPTAEVGVSSFRLFLLYILSRFIIFFSSCKSIASH